MNLLHVSGVITPRSYKLLEIPFSCVTNTMVKLKKEGVVEKSRNEEVFENLVVANYQNNLEKYFEENIPVDNLEFFERYGLADIKKAKYSKDKYAAEGRRKLRNAEITVLMFSTGIPTLPADKKNIVQNRVLTDNVYYQSREIKTYSGYVDDMELKGNEMTSIATRINGILLTAGGNYSIFHLGKDLQNWKAQGEYKMKAFIQNMLANYINQSSCMVNDCILITYNLDIFLHIIDPSRKYKERYEGLNMTYENLYVLPFDECGRDMIKIMAQPDWIIRVYEMIFEESYQDTSKLDFVCDYYDGNRYTFIFCVPNISRYLDFVRKVKYVNNRDMFCVVCFDYQREFVIASIGNYARILTADFKDFLEEWYS